MAHGGFKAPVHSRRLIFWAAFFLGICLAGGLFRPCVIGANSGLAYVVQIEGSVDKDLRKLLEAVSETIVLRKRPPASLNLLGKRVKQDIPRLKRALRSQGFYNPKVMSSIDGEAKPVKVVFQVDLGPPYLLHAVEIELSDKNAEPAVDLPSIMELGLSLEKPAQSKPILDAEQAIIRRLRKQGFPFPRAEKRKVLVDHATRRVSVTFKVQAGPLARFGVTTIEGLESVDEAFVMQKIPWREGDRFNSQGLDELKKRLNETGLFSTVEIITDKILGREGNLPVVISVKERHHRTVKTGASLKTDEGPGGKISWEHRNFFGRAEQLNLSGNASGIGFSLDGKFRKPEFLRQDQALLLSMRLAEDSPDAFTSQNLTGLGQIERALSKGMDLSVGLGYRTSKVEQFGEEDRFQLFFLPVNYQWNTSDKPLDPSSGGRLTLQGAPYYDLYGTNTGFIKGYARYSRYFQLSKKPFTVFAGRGILGSISGAERDDIPADLRFYSGGGGSIRGYAFQLVGPLRGSEPVGGRSLIGLSGEFRIKWTERIGFVGFLDGGNAFEASFPDFGESLRWGAGVGFRYFTAVGPLRLDVGFPLNRREGIDDAFQVYVSIGQAF